MDKFRYVVTLIFGLFLILPVGYGVMYDDKSILWIFLCIFLFFTVLLFVFFEFLIKIPLSKKELNKIERFINKITEKKDNKNE